MRPFLKITVNDDRLRIETRKGSTTAANLIGIVNGDTIFTIGETPDEILSRTGGDPLPSGVEFKPIFDARSFNQEIATASARYWKFHTGARNAISLSQSLDFSLEFPSYETLTPGLRESFELDIMINLRTVDFTINGQQAGYPLNQIRMADITIHLLNLLCLVLSIALLIWGITLTGNELIVVIPVAIVLLAIVFAITAFSHLLWARIMKRFVPSLYLRTILHSQSDRILAFKKHYRAAIDRILPLPTDLM